MLSPVKLLRACVVVVGLGTCSVCGLTMLLGLVESHSIAETTRSYSLMLTCQAKKKQPLPASAVRGLCENGLIREGRDCASDLPEMNYADIETLVHANIVANVDTYQTLERKLGKYRIRECDTDVYPYVCDYVLNREHFGIWVRVHFDTETNLVQSVSVYGPDC
jgi:hypothetical protein